MNCTGSLIDVLTDFLTVLWKDWPMDMKAVSLGPPQGLFSLRGTCPHCRDTAGFVLAGTSPNAGGGAVFIPASSNLMWGIMQCQSCLSLILACATRSPQNASDWTYSKHYPMGKPDDSVAEEIPPNIAADL